MPILPIAPVKRIAEECGVERVGLDATQALCIGAQEWIKKVAVKAQKYAKHAGRKTLKAEDIFVVVKEEGINIQMPPPRPRPVPAQKPVETPSTPGKLPV